MSLYINVDFDRSVYPTQSNAKIKIYDDSNTLLKDLASNDASLSWEYEFPVASVSYVGGNTIDINFTQDIEILWGMISFYDDIDALIDNIPSTSGNITLS